MALGSLLTSHYRAAPSQNGGWRWPLLLTAAVIVMPVMVIVGSLLLPYSESWGHLLETVVPRYVATSLWLMAGVGLGTFVIGVGAAWLTTAYEFPGRRMLSWALLLPMAMPAYIIAYAYTGLLDFSGPVQTLLRSLFDLQGGDYWFASPRGVNTDPATGDVVAEVFRDENGAELHRTDR